MHEVALAEGVMRIVADAAARCAAARVSTVWVELGALAHVERGDRPVVDDSRYALGVLRLHWRD